MTDHVTLGEKIDIVRRVMFYRPVLAAGIMTISVLAALLEGIGLSFILPIIELAQRETPVTEADGLLGVFFSLYQGLGLPFTLEFVVVGVGVVIVLRYTLSFAVDWLRAILRNDYVLHLQSKAFGNVLTIETGYLEQRGSDEFLNAIITQAGFADKVIQEVTRVVQVGLMVVVYVGIALYFSPGLTLVAALSMVVLVVGVRNFVESGYAVGERIATGNERLQETVQAGVQGLHDVKLFDMGQEVYGGFETAARRVTRAATRLQRNRAALDNFYQLLTALLVFALIYVALRIGSMSLGELGVFLFAMFRLAPRISTLNDMVYEIDADLPHVVRTHRFIDELAAHREDPGGSEPVPVAVQRLTFDGVSFRYEDEPVLEDVSFSVERDRSLAIVGPSGTGKSTLASLIARLYEPDAGEIRANGTSIEGFEVDDWRSIVSVVRQEPFIFNDTLRRNVTIGNRDASEEEVERACELACITEFLDDLDDGYDTELGEGGVLLSGGQRQRVALARALLKDAEILILDEATSELDSSLQERIQANIRQDAEERIHIVIAHRLSTVLDADRVIRLEDGRLVEDGPPEDVLDAVDEGSEPFSRGSE